MSHENGNSSSRWEALRQRIDAFLFGAALSWVAVPYTMRRRKEMERLFAFLATLRMLGVPMLPGDEELKLLPYLLPNLLYWKRMTGISRVLEGADLKHLGH